MNIQELPIDQLEAADYNPRKPLEPGDPDYEKLKRSITEYGYVEPAIWNRATGRLVGGHQRIQVLRDLGHATATVVVVDLDPVREKTLNIALNRISGEWDMPALATLLDDLQASDIDIELTGFDEDEIADMHTLLDEQPTADGDSGEEDGIEDDDWDPDQQDDKPTMTRAGDLWILGDHRLTCGDATGPDAYETVLAGDQVDLVITDPPYNVAYTGNDIEDGSKYRRAAIANDKHTDDDFRAFLGAALEHVCEAMTGTASIYVFHANRQAHNFITSMLQAGFHLSGCIVWVKNYATFGRSPYHWQHESCLYGWKKQGTHRWYGDRTQTTVWEYDKPQSSGAHPTMKPVPLLCKPLHNSSAPGDIVLDPFAGSGSLLIACEETGRQARLIELDPGYCDSIIDRWLQHTGGEGDVRLVRDGLTYSLAGARAMTEEDSDGVD